MLPNSHTLPSPQVSISPTSALRMKRIDAHKKADWAWLRNVSKVKVGLCIGETLVEFNVVATPGFIRAVDHNAMMFEVPRSGPLHRSMSDLRRHHHVTLWCQANGPLPTVFRVDGVGSIGLISGISCEEKASMVILRITALSVRCEGAQAVPRQVDLITLECS